MCTLLPVLIILTLFVLQVGDVGERPPGPRVADAAGEETPLYAASRQLQAFPDNGDQPEGIPHHLSEFLLFHILDLEFQVISEPQLTPQS